MSATSLSTFSLDGSGAAKRRASLPVATRSASSAVTEGVPPFEYDPTTKKSEIQRIRRSWKAAAVYKSKFASFLVSVLVLLSSVAWVSDELDIANLSVYLSNFAILRIDHALWSFNILLLGSLAGMLANIWLESPLQQRPISLISSSTLLVISSFTQLLHISLSLVLLLEAMQSAKLGAVLDAADDAEEKLSSTKHERWSPSQWGTIGILLLLSSSVGFLCKILFASHRGAIDAAEVISYFTILVILSYRTEVENDFLNWSVVPQVFRVLLFTKAPIGSAAGIAIRSLDITTFLCMLLGIIATTRSFKHAYASIQERRVQKLRNQLLTLFDQVTSFESRLRSSGSKAIPTASGATDAQTASIIDSFNKELRTVLHSVLNCITLITPSGDPVGTNQARQREYVRNLEGSVNILNALVSNTITLLKSLVGGVVLDKTRSFRVEDVFDRVIDRCKFVEHNREIDIICDIDPDVPRMLVGDHTVIEDLLSHLFDNAVRYTQKGEVRLTARIVERVDDQVRLALSVEDTGPGISPDILSTVSTPFKYGSANRGRSDMFTEEAGGESLSDTRSSGIREGAMHGTSGSGLGIPIASNLARLFPGGDLIMSSEPNSGTVCTFTALFAPQRHGSVPSFAHSEAPILCVCGPAFQASALPHLLNRQGLENVIAVADAEEAFSTLTKANTPIELVIIYDWTSKSSGSFSRTKAHEVAKQIRELSLKVQPKICVVVSADDVRKSRHAADSSIAMPIRLRSLKQVISRLLGDAQPSSDEAAGPRSYEKGRQRAHSKDSSTITSPTPTRTLPHVRDEDLKNVKLRILVAEDNRVNARVISASVKKEGHECVVTADGKTCVLEFCKDPSQRYDIVFMDLYMPGMNGIEATVQIREYEARLSQLPAIIIGVTAEDRHAEQSQMLKAGMDDIILKPVTVSGLRSFLVRAQTKKLLGSQQIKPFNSDRSNDSSHSSGSASDASLSSSGDGRNESHATRERKHILVAEDNDFTARMTLQVLKANGWESDRAKNGRDAFEMVTSNYEAYSAILMDIQMPLLDGLACTKQIREWERAHGIFPGMKILALTGIGDDDPEHRNECKAAGCDDFLPKPVSYPKLVPYLKDLLDLD